MNDCNLYINVDHSGTPDFRRLSSHNNKSETAYILSFNLTIAICVAIMRQMRVEADMRQVGN